jgi:hypothetical protein
MIYLPTSFPTDSMLLDSVDSQLNIQLLVRLYVAGTDAPSGCGALHLHRLPLQLECVHGHSRQRVLARSGRSCNAGDRAGAKGARCPVAPSEDAPHVGLRRQVGQPRVGVGRAAGLWSVLQAGAAT